MSGIDDTAPTTSGSPMGRRVGPAVAAAALVLTLVLLVWMAGPPGALMGPVAAAPFTLDATLVTSPDDEGCSLLVDGQGRTRTICGEPGSYEAWFQADGTVVVGHGDRYDVFDADTGTKVGQLDGDEALALNHGMPDPREGEAHSSLWTRGDQVLRGGSGGPWDCFGEGCPEPADGEEEEVLLDLDGPPGYQLHGAVLSPDGKWVVVLDARDRVLVAPLDGTTSTTGAYVWIEYEEGWVDLGRGIRWD